MVGHLYTENNMSLLSTIENAVVTLIGKINWKNKNLLDHYQRDQIREMLKNDYYIILTRNNSHLSSYAISFANFILTGKFSYYAHALMNFEDKVDTDADFRLIQATGAGVNYTSFDEVFAVNGVTLLKPKSMKIEEWTLILDKAKSDVGKPYDTLYDLADDNKLSCVELVRDALKADPNYSANFSHFEKMITKNKNLTPQMYYDCDDFEIVLEFRNK